MIRSFTATFGGIVLYAVKRDETAEFYRKLGLDFTSEQHGDGPVHFCSTVKPKHEHPTIVEVYQATAVVPRAVLMFYVTDIEAALEAVGQEATARIRAISAGRIATVTDPDGQRVMLFQQIGD